MASVLWQSRSPRVFESYASGVLDARASGGNAYDVEAAQALATAFKVELDPVTVRRSGESIASYWQRLRRHRPAADLLVRDPHVIVFGPPPALAPAIAMVHHVEFHLRERSLAYRWFFHRLLSRLRGMQVVTVSEFWRQALVREGCRRVEVIHNAFDVGAFVPDPAATQAFLRREDLDTGRPLIYIGNALRQKGVVEVYEALRNENYDLVMTGRSCDVDIPVRWLQLDRRDYLHLLHGCDAVIVMSQMIEGWNRVAHEAMLCGKPVIGSGTGGMRELLQGGGQVILDDPAGLPEALDAVLRDAPQIGARGREFASRFDRDYFRDRWLGLARRMLGTPGAAAASESARP